jgi:hypothetical protein
MRTGRIGCWMSTAFQTLALVSATFDARAIDGLPEATDPLTRRFAVVFDFDTDSCYPSPAISPAGQVNPGLSVTGPDASFVSGCRSPAQLTNSNTYHRRAVIKKGGVTYEVRMYALYFMKDKDTPFWQAEGVFGHRHDWEFALVWITDGRLTHASYSAHGRVTTKAISDLSFDGWCPECVKVVYHKDGGSTHAMRFAGTNEPPENDTGKWLTPALVDWYGMPVHLQTALNTFDFGHSNCSVCDRNFPYELRKGPPPGYPNKDEWQAAAGKNPSMLRPGIDVLKQSVEHDKATVEEKPDPAPASRTPG